MTKSYLWKRRNQRVGVSASVPVYSCDAKFELQCPSECPSEKREQSVGNSNIEYDKKG